jgi:hypothetical protein
MNELIFNEQVEVKPGAKLILEVNFPDCSDRKQETIVIYDITDLLLDKYRYDGYKLKSFKILSAIETYEDANTLMNFLRIHKYCFTLPKTHANNIINTK